VLNVTFPLVPEEIAQFCLGKRAVLIVEEGTPEYIEPGDSRLAAPAGHQHADQRQGQC